MKSIIVKKENQSNDSSPVPSTSLGNINIQNLASHYMQMFDAANLGAGLLSKRPVPFFNTFANSEPYKKIQPSPSFGSASCFPNFSNPYFNHCPDTLVKVEPNQGETQLMNLNKLLEPQNNFRQSLQCLQREMPPLYTMNNKALFEGYRSSLSTESVYLKEEHVEQESQTNYLMAKIDLKQITSECKTDLTPTNDKDSDSLSNRSELKNHSNSDGSPSLAEFTQMFPEWDLATIFSFIRSGKSRDDFRQTKKYRLEKKLQNLENKEKARPKKSKTSKTRKNLRSKDEYRPPRSARRSLQNCQQPKNDLENSIQLRKNTVCIQNELPLEA